MRIGTPREIKVHEYRVGLTPPAVHELVLHGHDVWIEADAGVGIGVNDTDYVMAGAVIKNSAAEIFAGCDMIVKVKEPQAVEVAQLRAGQILFTYLHLAPDPAQTQGLLKSGVTAIAYETVVDNDGRLPLLAPMSEVAGRLSIQVGAHFLEKAQGGRGVLLPGVPGVEPGHVLVIGGGVAGSNAAQVALGMGAQVTLLDTNIARLRQLQNQFGTALNVVVATRAAVQKYLAAADLVIGAVLVPGAAAPKVITRDMLKLMQPGAVIVDIAIDQGGCLETSHATTHDDPVYTVDGIIHYCVANMPGAVARTSAYALNNVTLPYVLALADKGLDALRFDKNFRAGLNVHHGQLTCAAVAEAQSLKFVSAESVLA